MSLKNYYYRKFFKREIYPLRIKWREEDLINQIKIQLKDEDIKIYPINDFINNEITLKKLFKKRYKNINGINTLKGQYHYDKLDNIRNHFIKVHNINFGYLWKYNSIITYKKLKLLLFDKLIIKIFQIINKTFEKNNKKRNNI